VVNHKYFSTAYPRYRDGKASYQDSVGKFSMRGYSKDDPTPLMRDYLRKIVEDRDGDEGTGSVTLYLSSGLPLKW
jgi:hypothetical protein